MQNVVKVPLRFCYLISAAFVAVNVFVRDGYVRQDAVTIATRTCQQRQQQVE